MNENATLSSHAAAAEAHDVDEAVFDEWITISKILYLSVIGVSAVTLPFLSLSAVMLRHHRRSQYYISLIAIIIGNIVHLGTITLTVLMERYSWISMFLQGPIMCKATGFLVNVSSCFVYWSWVVMYIHRCYYVFFPMRARRKGPSSRIAGVVGVLIFSILTQIWAPILMTEKQVSSNQNAGSYCGEINVESSLLQTTVIMECVLTFFIPFFLTVVTDISVLVLRPPCQASFTLISSEALSGCYDSSCTSNDGQYLKIVSQKIYQTTERRRHAAIRRCLLMATLNLLLNLPNYSLQLIDEFSQLRNSRSSEAMVMFLWADAAAYILYLLQFPLVPIYIFILKGDLDRNSSKKRDLKQQHSHSNGAAV